MAKYKYQFVIFNDNHIVEFAPTKADAIDIINDLPCFSKSDIEIKKQRVSNEHFATTYNTQA